MSFHCLKEFFSEGPRPSGEIEFAYISPWYNREPWDGLKIQDYEYNTLLGTGDIMDWVLHLNGIVIF